MLNFLFLRDEGFFCSLDVHYGGLGILKIFVFSCNFFLLQFLVFKILDLDPDPH
jgi:hypothetical protein